MAVLLLSRRCVLVALLAGSGTIGTQLLDAPVRGAAYDNVDLGKVPAKVKEAASKAMPRARWTGAPSPSRTASSLTSWRAKTRRKVTSGSSVTAAAKVTEVGIGGRGRQGPPGRHGGTEEEIPPFEGGSRPTRPGTKVRSSGTTSRGSGRATRRMSTVSVSPDGKTVELEED